MIEERAWTAAVTAVREARTATLACHVNPDGDALGAMLAVGLAMRAHGVAVTASFPDPFIIPDVYTFLPGLDLLVPPSEVDAAPALVLAFDTGALDRLGSLAMVAQAAQTSIVLDHHATNDGFATIDLVDASAAATAVISRELLRRLGWDLDRDIAICLYTALVTDTGRFQYRNTTPGVHALAGELLGHGVAQDEISRRVFETRTLPALKLDAIALARLEVDESASMVWTFVTEADIETVGGSGEDIDGLIDTIRQLDTADVALLLKQRDGAWKASMRSKGGHDVGAVCARFGGGGHQLAAGCTLQTVSARDAMIAIADEVRAHVTP